MKRIFKVALLLIYGLLFGEIYVRFLEFSQLTNVQVIDTKEIAAQKINIKIKKEAEINILIIGDSLLAGYGVNPEDIFSNVLADTLENRMPNKKTKVIDTLVGGFNMYKKWELFKKFIENNPKPQILLLSYKFGDVYGTFLTKTKSAGLNFILAKEAKVSHLKNFLYKSEFFKFIMPRLNTLLKKHGIVLKFTEFYHLQNKAYLPDYNGWVLAQEYILDMNRICKDNGIRFIILLIPDFSLLPQNLFKKNTLIFSDFCKENNTKFIDAIQWFKDIESDELAISRFDGHPNFKAHRILAEKMADIIMNIN